MINSNNPNNPNFNNENIDENMEIIKAYQEKDEKILKTILKKNDLNNLSKLNIKDAPLDLYIINPEKKLIALITNIEDNVNYISGFQYYMQKLNEYNIENKIKSNVINFVLVIDFMPFNFLYFFSIISEKFNINIFLKQDVYLDIKNSIENDKKELESLDETDILSKKFLNMDISSFNFYTLEDAADQGLIERS